MLRKKKYIHTNHAEKDLIYKAARKGIATDGLTMIMPWLPCIPCANTIISSEIEKMVFLISKWLREQEKDGEKNFMRL